jgi:RNA polymerase sigma-70 factor, ECF subfamily
MDNKLLLKLKEGNEKSYQLIFDDFYSLLTAFAYKYLRDLDQAKEVVQNVFVKFYEKRKSIEITTSFKSYLYKMVYNDCLALKRKQSVIDLAYSNYASEHLDDADYTQLIEQTEEEYKLHQLIERLPDKCKEIFKLSRFEERKNPEIAQMLNLSIRTVETQISKALKFLRANYKSILRCMFILTIT